MVGTYYIDTKVPISIYVISVLPPVFLHFSFFRNFLATFLWPMVAAHASSHQIGVYACPMLAINGCRSIEKSPNIYVIILAYLVVLEQASQTHPLRRVPAFARPLTLHLHRRRRVPFVFRSPSFIIFVKWNIWQYCKKTIIRKSTSVQCAAAA